MPGGAAADQILYGRHQRSGSAMAPGEVEAEKADIFLWSVEILDEIKTLGINYLATDLVSADRLEEIKMMLQRLLKLGKAAKDDYVPDATELAMFEDLISVLRAIDASYGDGTKTWRTLAADDIQAAF